MNAPPLPQTFEGPSLAAGSAPSIPPPVEAGLRQLARHHEAQRERELRQARLLNARLTREIGQRIQLELAIDELLRAHARGEALGVYVTGLAEARRPWLLPNERGS